MTARFGRSLKAFALLILLTAGAGLSACRLTSRPSAAEVGAEYLRQTLQALPDLPTSTPEPAPPRATLPSSSDLDDYAPPTPWPRRDSDPYFYLTRSGDTARALAGRFGVDLNVVTVQINRGPDRYLVPGTGLEFPDQLPETTAAQLVLPDAELIYSPTASDFNLYTIIREAGGYLAGYQEVVGRSGVISAPEIISRVARDQSINPRLLLALIEIRSGWLYARPPGAERVRYPLGFRISGQEGLYDELRIAATQLNAAYYGWRRGDFTTIHYQGGTDQRLDPTLNAGTAALYHLFSFFSRESEISQVLLGSRGFTVRYHSLYGDPWERASLIEPLLPDDLEQPALSLPFSPGEKWSYTGGPHPTWNAGTPRGAVDFAPVTGEPHCAVSRRWVTAPAQALVARAAQNAVILDLDGDGEENTGWALLFFHLAENTLTEEGVWVDPGTRLGRPSCQGGFTTGTHLHLARKYNGEWLPADGPVPMVLSGWTVQAADDAYRGRLVRDGAVIEAAPDGRPGSTVIRR